NGDDGDDDAGADVVVLVAVGAGEGVQGHRNGLEVAGLQVEVRHIVFVVDADALQKAAGDDGRLEQGQQDLEEYAEIGAAVQDGALVQGAGQVLEELQKDVDRDDIGAAQNQDVAVQVVDEPQREHDLVDGDLGGDARDEGGEHEQVVDQPAARETEAVEDISQHRADEDGEQQDKDQGDACIE